MKILVINKLLKQRHKDLILEASAKCDGEVLFVDSENDVPDDYKDCDIIYGFGMGIAGHNKNLKWLAVPSAGVDYLLKPGIFANKDCLITNSSGAYGVTIAEHIIAVSLMMMRKLDHAYRESIQGIWSNPVPQRSLKDSKILVLGTGDIGCCFARRAKAFEPERIIGISRSGMCSDPVYDRMEKVDRLDDLLPETDLLVMSLPDTSETKNILSRERIALLNKDAFIVNVGRGSAIDEEALCESLNEGRLAGAALDVFRTEPLPKESALWNTRNLLITPHVAGNLTLEHTLDRNVEMFCMNLENFGQGLPLNNLIDREKQY